MRGARTGRVNGVVGAVLCIAGLMLIGVVIILLRLGVITDHLYNAAVKDPHREIPEGRVVVAPADGTVVYIRRFSDGVIPEVVKLGVPVSVTAHMKNGPVPPFENGYLIGIYMNAHGVHLNRIPVDGVVSHRTIYNGPHMDMTEVEKEVILRQLIPGAVSIRKWFGLEPFDLEDKADFVLRSAREALTIVSSAGPDVTIVRIADYYVGKILTWVEQGESVSKGSKFGMITWGSQTDLFIEAQPALRVTVDVGDYVYGGETIIADY